MIAALLAFCFTVSTSKFWRWDYNIDSAIAKYQVRTAIRSQLYTDCLDDEGRPARCLSYSDVAWTTADNMSADVPPVGMTYCTAYDANSSVSLPLGSVLYVNVISLDAAGNIGNWHAN